jgi:hypothetical protein
VDSRQSEIFRELPLSLVLNGELMNPSDFFPNLKQNLLLKKMLQNSKGLPISKKTIQRLTKQNLKK